MAIHQFSSGASARTRRAATALIVAASVAIAVGVPPSPAAGATGSATLGTITTAVGTIGDGGPAASAYLQPTYLATDVAGNIYVPEQNRLRKIAAGTHVITTIAGNGLAGFSGDGGQALDASIRPSMVAVAPNGDVYFSDHLDHVIRKIAVATGIITTVVGSGVAGSTGDGGQAASAQLYSPLGLAFDSSGALFIADATANKVRKVGTNGIISTLAGTGAPGFNGDNQASTTAQLKSPVSVTVDGSDNLYISDTGNNRIRRVVAATGIITTIAGTGFGGFNGDGAANLAQLNQPLQIAYSNNYISVADNANQRVRRIGLLSNSIFTLAGTGVDGTTGDGGPAASATLGYPFGVAVIGSTVFLADQSTKIRAISGVGTANVTIAAFAGIGRPFAGDGGPATNAVIGQYLQLAAAPNNDLYFADGYNARIRKVSATTGIISTVAGTGSNTFNGDGPIATTNIDPDSVAVDAAGNVYFSQDKDAFIRKLTIATGQITTIAGTGTQAFNGDGAAATTNIEPTSIALDGAGNLYFSDYTAARIRKLDLAANTITTVAGTGAAVFNGDGPGATTTVKPDFIAVAQSGDVYVTDSTNERVRRFTVATGMLTTIIGTGVSTFNGDHAGLATNLEPAGITVDVLGNVYIADYFGNTVRRYDHTTMMMSTVAGTGQPGSTGDGGPAAAAELVQPTTVAIDTAGRLYIADGADQRVRMMTTDVTIPAYNPVAPERLLDTRTGVGAPAGKLAAGNTLTLQITGAGTTNVPANASAVAINVTVTGPDADGFLTVWPCGSPQPLASNLNYTTGQTIPNLVIAKLGNGGTICIAGQATTHVIADINGWFG